MKMKISKKVLSLLVVFALACSLIPVFTSEAQALVTQEESEEHYHTRSLKVGDTITLQTSLSSSTGAYGWVVYMADSRTTEGSSVLKMTSSKYNQTCSFEAVGTGTVIIEAATKVYDTLALNYYCYDYWTVTVTKSGSSSGTTSGSSSSGTKKIAPSSITLNKSSVSIKRGKSKKLKYTISPSNANTKKKVTFTSSNKKVATVNSKGRVTAKKVGTATITVKTANGKTDTCTVKVTRPDPTSVSLNKKKTTLIVGKTTKLKASVTPGDAKKKLKWTSSNKKVATVNANGKIKAKKAGTTKITVRTSNGKTATCRVTVKDINAKKIKLSKKKLSLIKGKTAKLTYKLIPSNATNTVKWTSSNKKVATVNKKGKVRAKSGGTAKITATTSNGKKAVCKVTVTIPIKSVSLGYSSLTLSYIGKTYTFNAVVKPANTTSSKKLTWTSSNTSVATVNSNGKVTAKGPGTTTITARTVNGKTRSCKVTVLAPITGISLSVSSATIEPGYTKKLVATISPSNTTDDTTITWTSSDTDVATVSSAGVVTAVAPGTTTITAETSNGKTATCKVTVPEVEATAVTFSEECYEVEYGSPQTLSLSMTPANATTEVTWTSSNTSVASVASDGTVTVKKAGTVTITAETDNGLTASCEVTAIRHVKTLLLWEETTSSGSVSSMTICENLTRTLTAMIYPSLESVSGDVTLSWSTSDSSVVTVDESESIYKSTVSATTDRTSTSVVLVPHSQGSATVTATTSDGLSTSVAITVRAPGVTGIEFESEEIEIEYGSILNKLTYTVSPSDADDTIYWYSSDESVVTVSYSSDSDDTYVYISPKGVGTATITAKPWYGYRYGDYSASVTVTVTEAD